LQQAFEASPAGEQGLAVSPAWQHEPDRLSPPEQQQAQPSSQSPSQASQMHSEDAQQHWQFSAHSPPHPPQPSSHVQSQSHEPPQQSLQTSPQQQAEPALVAESLDAGTRA